MRVCHAKRARRNDGCSAQERFSVIEAPRNALSERMVTVCLLPEVRIERLALNPGALATTWKLPLPPLPSTLPLTLRLVSLQVPESTPPRAMTLLDRLKR